MAEWATIPEFPEYEISATGVIRNKESGNPVQVYGGKDYEYVKTVYLWRAGIRETRSLIHLYRTTLAVTSLGLDERIQVPEELVK